MARIVGGIAHFRGRAERITDPLGGAFIIGSKGDTHMAVVENGVVLPIGALDLVERLRDQERFEAITGHEGECRFKEVQPPERGELVQHQQQAMALAGGFQLLGQPPPDLIEDQTDQRLGPVDVRGRYDEVEADRFFCSDQISNAPVAAGRHAGHDRISVEAEKRHRRGQHTGAFVLRFVQQLACRRSDDGMHTGFAQMRRVHHGAQGCLDRTAGIGQKTRDAGERLFLLGVKDMQDRADQQRMAGLFPMVALVETALGIDQNIRDVLDIADFPLPLTDFQQRVVSCGMHIGRIEQQDAAVMGPEAGRQIPVLPLDVVHDATSRPGQQRRHNETDAFA